ncbi:hypothetical protein FQN54_009951 [Arachnomyces sp. PD_36]|nr:hypothetical protein FQN54_009951 [Arachnomyces sp. PD_36]
MSSDRCLLLQALDVGQVLEVKMNKIDFVSFSPTSPVKAIGTRNLNGCTAVLVVSKLGALLGHISPLPYPTTNPAAGENHMREKMTELWHLLFTVHNKSFPDPKKAGVVSATLLGSVGLPAQKKLAEDIFKENDVPVNTFLYDAQNSANMSAKGTVFIDGRQPSPIVYVEDDEKPWFNFQ